MADEKLPRWPAWMPVVQQQSYGYQPTDRRTRTDMEVGSIVRVNFDTDETQFTCSLLLDRMQSAWFEVFERDMLNQGAHWFEIPLQSGGEITWHKARFQTRPKASLPGPWHTTYSFTLEVDKRPATLCPQIAEFLTCASPQDLCRSGEAMRRAMQEVVPSIDLPDFWAVRETAPEEVA